MAYPMRLDNPTTQVDGKWKLPSAIFKCIGTGRLQEYDYIEFSQLMSADGRNQRYPNVKGRYRIVRFSDGTCKLMMLRGEDGWKHDQAGRQKFGSYWQGWDYNNVWTTWSTETNPRTKSRVVEYYHVWMGDIVRVEPVDADGVYNIVYARGGSTRWNMKLQLDDSAHDLLAFFLGDIEFGGFFEWRRPLGYALDRMLEESGTGAAAAAAPAAADTTEAVCTLRF